MFSILFSLLTNGFFLSYIKSKSFEIPLTAKEEEKYLIQSDDEKKIGFVPKNALNNDKVLCKRCFRLKNYHELQKTNLTSDDFLNILQGIGNHDCLVVYLIDLFDFNGSLISGYDHVDIH